jgi:hypothetical protein
MFGQVVPSLGGSIRPPQNHTYILRAVVEYADGCRRSTNGCGGGSLFQNAVSNLEVECLILF